MHFLFCGRLDRFLLRIAPPPVGCVTHRDDQQIYRREYKRRFAWIRAGKISQEAFSAWSKDTQKEKERCENGSIDQKEFTKWLKQ